MCLGFVGFGVCGECVFVLFVVVGGCLDVSLWFVFWLLFFVWLVLVLLVGCGCGVLDVGFGVRHVGWCCVWFRRFVYAECDYAEELRNHIPFFQLCGLAVQIGVSTWYRTNLKYNMCSCN